MAIVGAKVVVVLGNTGQQRGRRWQLMVRGGSGGGQNFEVIRFQGAARRASDLELRLK